MLSKTTPGTYLQVSQVNVCGGLGTYSKSGVAITLKLVREKKSDHTVVHSTSYRPQYYYTSNPGETVKVVKRNTQDRLN